MLVLRIGSPRSAPDTTRHDPHTTTHDPHTTGWWGERVEAAGQRGHPLLSPHQLFKGESGMMGDGITGAPGQKWSVVPAPLTRRTWIYPSLLSPTLIHWGTLGSGEVLRWGLGNSQVFRPRHEKSGGRGGSQWDLKTPRLRFQTTSGRVNPPTEIPRSGPRQLNRGGHGSGSRRTGPMQLPPPPKKKKIRGLGRGMDGWHGAVRGAF